MRTIDVICPVFREEEVIAPFHRRLSAALEPYQTGVYVNFLMDEGEQRVREAYGAEKLDRLTALKRKYDPQNFFHLNQNIRPASEG